MQYNASYKSSNHLSLAYRKSLYVSHGNRFLFPRSKACKQDNATWQQQETLTCKLCKIMDNVTIFMCERRVIYVNKKVK